MNSTFYKDISREVGGDETTCPDGDNGHLRERDETRDKQGCFVPTMKDESAPNSHFRDWSRLFNA